VKELPKFTKQSSERVKHFAVQVFTHPSDPEKSYFQELREHEDKHFSVIFSLNYFGNTTTPTKSQWNSLKKKFKRHDKLVFVFKEHFIVKCGDGEGLLECGQIEFGYLREFNLR
jgi:hypothetical protein